MTNTDTLDINFGGNKLLHDWYVVNDGVMGGLSKSELSPTDTSLLFKGTVSLENNGGFASIRSPFSEYNLSVFSKVTIRYKSQGQDMALVLAPFKRWYYPTYKSILKQTNDQWETVAFALKDFKEYRVGEFTGSYVTDELLEKIIRLGFITNNKKACEFQFEVDFIRFE
jgi:hypothetical protein